MRVIEEPEWFKVLAPDSLVSSKDTALLFGFSSQESLISSVRTGSFPPSDKMIKRYPYRPKHYWKASTLRKEIKRRLAARSCQKPM